MNARRFLPALLLAAILLPGTASAQKKDPTPIAAVDPKLGRGVDFESDVLTILEDNCIACHNLAIDEGKLSLEDVEGIMKGGKRGPAVVAGKPDESLLFQFASHIKNPIMPPAGNKVEATNLTPRELGIVKQWITEGAKVGMGNGDANVVWSPLPSHMQAVYSLALTPWADTVVVGRANRVLLFDTATGTQLAALTDPAIAKLEADGKPTYGEGIAHRDFVHAIAISPDGNRIATSGYRIVKIWERVARAAGAQQNAGGKITSVAVSADGKLAAFGSEDKSIRLWSIADNKITKTLNGHEAAVTGLAFTPDAAKLVSGSKDKSLRVWNVADGQQAIKLDLPAESNDLCLNAEGTRAISADADNKLRIWDLPAEQPMPEKPEDAPQPFKELAGHGGPVNAVRLIGQGPQIVSGGQAGQVRTWDANSGAAVRTMNHGGPVTAVAASADGLQLASAGETGTAKLWTTANGAQVAETAKQPEASRNVLLLVEEQTVAKQKVALADAAQKEAEKNLEDRKKALDTSTKAQPALDKALADAEAKLPPAEKKLADAKQAAEGKPDDDNLKKAVTTAETELQKLKDEVTKATTARDAGKRAIELAGNSVKTAEGKLEERKQAKTAADAVQKTADDAVETGKKTEAEAPKPLRSIAFTAGGQVVTGGDDNRLTFWTNAGTYASRTEPGPAAITSLATLPDGQLLVGADKTLSQQAAGETWKLAGYLGPNGDDPMQVADSRFVGRVLALAFSHDGKLLATGGGEPSRSGELLIWNAESRELVKEIVDAHSDSIFDVEFSRDGQWLVAGAADKFVKLFDVAKGEFVRSYEGHTHHVLGVAVKADNSEIVSAGADEQIKVWNLETGEQKRTIKNYAKEVTSIDYIGVGENTLSGGGDRTVRLHKTSNGQNYRSLTGNGDFVYATAAARDENVLVSGGADGVVRIWDKNGALKLSIEPPKPEEPQTAAN